MSTLTPFEYAFYKVPYGFHAVSVVISIYTLYQVTSKAIVKGITKKLLLVTQCWNILLQFLFVYIFQFWFLDNSDKWWKYKIFSVIWVLEHTLILMVVSVNLSILRLFWPLNEALTEKRIFLGQKISLGLFLLFILLPSLRILTPQLPLGTDYFMNIEQKSCFVYVILSIIYDNCQATYLVLLIKNYHRSQVKARTDQFLNKLKRAMLINILVVGMDWIIIFCFLAQILFFPRTASAFAVQEIATAVAGIHAAMLIIVFQRLKDLTFPNRRESNPTPVKIVELHSEPATFRVKQDTTVKSE